MERVSGIHRILAPQTKAALPACREVTGRPSAELSKRLPSGVTSGLPLRIPLYPFIPGTTGANLRSTVETIKANLGFDRLQQMRDASPTGGALGQVAVKELDALQSSVSSLDLNQSPDRLRNNLEQIKTHYARWRQAAMGKLPEEKRQQQDFKPAA